MYLYFIVTQDITDSSLEPKQFLLPTNQFPPPSFFVWDVGTSGGK